MLLSEIMRQIWFTIDIKKEAEAVIHLFNMFTYMKYGKENEESVNDEGHNVSKCCKCEGHFLNNSINNQISEIRQYIKAVTAHK